MEIQCRYISCLYLASQQLDDTYLKRFGSDHCC